MATSFERFKEQLDDAIDTIDSGSSRALSISTDSLASGDLVDTNSLLARCETICKQRGSDRPVIRVIFNLTGDKINSVSEYISALPNVFLLDEIEYLTESDCSSDSCGNSNLLSLAINADIPNPKDLADNLFEVSTKEIHKHIEDIGGTLVLSLLIEYDLLTKRVELRESAIIELLKRHFNVKFAFVFCNPIDSYSRAIDKSTYCKNSLDFTEYCSRLSALLDRTAEKMIFSVESINGDPVNKMDALTSALDIPVDDATKEICWATVELPADFMHNSSSSIAADALKSGDSVSFKALHHQLLKFDIDLLSVSSCSINTPTENNFQSSTNLLEYIKNKKRVVITVAGMRHSGSTALFNILRLAIEKSGLRVFSGYSEKLDLSSLTQQETDVLLIKTHEMRDDVRDISDILITTVRDLRDTVASAKRRKFATLERVGGPIEYAKFNRSLNEIWHPYSDFEFRYESFMDKPLQTIQELLFFIGISDFFAEEICAQVQSLPTDNYVTTLLSPTHITDPDRQESYWSTLSVEVISKIETQHFGWLTKNGYA